MHRSQYLRQLQPTVFKVLEDSPPVSPPTSPDPDRLPEDIRIRFIPLKVPVDLYLNPEDEFRTSFNYKDTERVANLCWDRFPDRTYRYFSLGRLCNEIGDALMQESTSTFSRWLSASLYKHITYWLGYKSYHGGESLSSQFDTFLDDLVPTFKILFHNQSHDPPEWHIQECADQERALTESVFREYPNLAEYGQQVNDKVIDALVPLLERCRHIPIHYRAERRSLINQFLDLMATNYIELDLLRTDRMDVRKSVLSHVLNEELEDLEELEERVLDDVTSKAVNGGLCGQRGLPTEDGWGMVENVRPVEA